MLRFSKCNLEEPGRAAGQRGRYNDERRIQKDDGKRNKMQNHRDNDL